MRQDKDYLDGLVQLHRVETAEERRATWRQSMASLAGMVSAQRRPVPLEGLDPDALCDSVAIALEDRLVDDLEFLSAPAAAAALYELAAALPVSDEKRHLGRRILSRLHSADAATFVALATQLALGSKRALSGPSIRARVALSLDLPIGAAARADALALALISRRELEREWLAAHSTGSLPARRLAARLLERAAREAARQAFEGDDSGVRVFESISVRAAWDRLLADRESLVWRHVANARGLLSGAIPDLADEVRRHLDPRLTPTEWRRAAVSLAASIAIDPEVALRRSRALLDSDVVMTDPGVTGSMILGLHRAAEVRPAEAEALLEDLVRGGGLPAAEALVDLRRERIANDFGMWAAQFARAQLRESLASEIGQDDGRTALMECVADELAPGTTAPTLRDLVADALDAFISTDAPTAYERAVRVVEAANDRVTELAQLHDGDTEQRLRGFRVLRELDLALFESDRLPALLTLGARPDDPGEVIRPLGDVFERLTNLMVLKEGDPIIGRWTVDHFTLRLRRLRAMLHLVDADGAHVDDRTDLLRKRRLLTASILLSRAREEGKTPLRRTLCAATARACDALVREEICELSDVLIAAGSALTDPEDVETIAEASMVPELEAAVRAYGRLESVVRDAPHSGAGVRQCLDGLLSLGKALPVASSPRVEAMRREVLSFTRALEGIASAASLTEISHGDEGNLLEPLAESAQSLARLVTGARRRVTGRSDGEMPASGNAIRLLDYGIQRAQKGAKDAVDAGISSAVETLRLELPHVLSEIAILTLDRMSQLPLEAPPETRPSFIPLVTPKEAPLPPWMPPGRILGGFYVLRQLGAGAVGSVFMARRSHERDDDDAERFALKVPDYDGSAARALSEDQFHQLFRDEAGALLSIPQHPNLAHFVTFDAGAKPKPILVMELIEGPTLERVILRGDLRMRDAFDLLDGIAAGLQVMHAVGVGHLDVKPSNVILREGGGVDRRPVLVDFGLAGRNLRPGCATGEYGAPEIWGEGVAAAAGPEPADVYAFACVAYEVLTGQTLFAGDNELSLITAHVSHDGAPERIQRLAKNRYTADLGRLLAASLRREPSKRTTIERLRGGLSDLRARLGNTAWPLPA